MKHLIIGFAIAALSGCASFEGATPTTFNQKLAVGYGTVAAVRSTATNLLVAKKISSADAVNVQKQADTAREGLDVAKAMASTDLVDANVKLSSVTSALQVLQRYLVSKGGAQ